MEGGAGAGGTYKKSLELEPEQEVNFLQIQEPELEAEALTPLPPRSLPEF